MSGISWEEAVAQVTAPGSRFALVDAEIDGRKHKLFEHTPPSLRAIFDTARDRGDEVYLVYEDERWTFAEVMARIDAMAALMVDHYGIAKGDRVAIAMRNYPDWIFAFAAATSIGAIGVCLNAWWTSEEMEYGLSDSGSVLLVADRERIERAEPFLERLGLRALAIRCEGEQMKGVERLEDVLVEGASMPNVEIAPDDDATILYTSGTTGHPKGAVSTHRAVASALMAFGCRAGANLLIEPPKEPHPYPTSFILVVPLFHVTGLIPVMLSTFSGGFKLVMMYKWNPERALELIERERVTTFVGVPTMSWDLLESPDFSSRDTTSLTSVGGGGAPAPPELVRRVDEGFAKGRPGIGYGMTETCAYGPQNGGADYLRKPRSAGRVVPMMRLKVADEEGNELARGEVGEILFWGPNLIRGYWNKPEATAETFRDGWLRSGDLGRMDEEGFIFVEDRAKDMVLRAGENIYCAEVEAAIYQHASVYEAAVLGLPHPRLGEEVAVVIYPKPGKAIDAEELQGFLREHIAGFKIPTIVEIRGEQLPRNASGKILKRDLRDQLIERREKVVKRALVLGGGGVIGVAWEVGLLTGLAEGGVDVRDADLVVGTSAGSLVGSRVAAGIDFQGAPVESTAPPPLPFPESGPDMASLAAVFETWSSVQTMTEAGLREIGTAALGAKTVSEADWIASTGGGLGFEDWPEKPLRLCTVDAHSGEFCVHSRETDSPLGASVAASCAVPGMFPPIGIGGARYMDGGVRSGTSADVALDFEPDVVLIVAPICEATVIVGALAERCLADEVAQLVSAGAKVRSVLPLTAEVEAFGGNLMDPTHVDAAREAGHARGLRLASDGDLEW